MNIWLITLPLFLLLSFSNCQSGALLRYPGIVTTQDPGGIIFDHIYDENVKTVMLYRKGWELSYPLIQLNSDDRLVLRFDDLGGEIRNLYYTFVHCDAGWTPSNLTPGDYMDGFTDNQLSDYSYSFNTTHPYLHYELAFPNDDVKLKVSGNYIIKIYSDFNQEALLFTRRFSVYEPLVKIKTEVKRPGKTEFYDRGQEIDVSIDYSSYKLNDPMEEIQLVVRQNGRWDNMLANLKPLFFRDQELVYDYNQENVLPGGNEYRYFDISSLRFQSEFIRNIDLRKPHYHIELYPGEMRSGKPYFTDQEINGKYLVKVQEGRNNHTDADYIYVYFTLPMNFPLQNGRVYVYGALTNWEYQSENEMHYNQEVRAYELSLLLKQGYYNYHYVFMPDNKVVGDAGRIEGNHYQTENDYLIYVYHRSSISRFDRLIGLDITNSSK